MKTRVRWVEDHRFVATTGSGFSLVLDNPHREGGAAASPMELLLVSLAGCTGVDVVAILDKMRQPLERFEVEVEGFRAEEHPRVYTRVAVVYRGWGEVAPKKLLKAVELSEEKYCSVTEMLRPTAKIEIRVELNGEPIA
ncbi:MAG: OsmC family protein [Acidobacteria bacterium]|nr:OsmC family protein [Acidobacteriota bacterium]